MNQTLVQDTVTTTSQVVSVDHLRVRYGDTMAVDDVSLSINRGEIFGILGPNGAGKTTTVECIGGLRRPDAGSISVLSLDPQDGRHDLHQRVGIQLQASELPDKLRVGVVITDPHARHYGTELHGGELTPREGARIGKVEFDTWLAANQQDAP